MFRSHFLTCPFRLLLLVKKETHCAAFPKCPGAGWQSTRAAKEWRYNGIYGSQECTLSSSFPKLDSNNQLRENLQSKHPLLRRHHRHHLQVSVSAASRQPFAAWTCSALVDLSQNVKECSAEATCLEPHRRPWDIFQPSLTFSKNQCNLPQSYLYYRQHFARPFSSLKQHPWRLNRPCTSSISFHQVRAIHQAAPYVAQAWRDCLSLENENRCRQKLGPNLKLYDVRQVPSQSQGKNRARWASVLVSLCSVEGEPSFLFTLRSSRLKGRHKGDVSFAGGKSDPSDSDVVATALREAKEELGVTVGTERVWGTLKPLRDVTGMLIAPVLANLGPIEELSFKPNPAEVEEIFTLSVSHLCNPHNCGYTHFRTGDKYGYTLPVFRNGKHRVWGLTAVALDHTLKLVVPS